MNILNQHPLSLSPPSTPPLKNDRAILPPPPPQPQQQPRSVSHSFSSHSALLSRSTSLHSKSPSSSSSTSSNNTNSLFFSPLPPLSRSSTLYSSCSSNSSLNLACPPTPPQSNHNTPLSDRYRSITNLTHSDRPTPIRSTSRNDIFALSLPPPSLPPTPRPTAQQIIQPDSSSSYDQQDLLRLKTNFNLRINANPSSVLGEGTHGIVHIALCSKQPHPWKICAAKLSEDIAGSIKETLVLERLRSREGDENGTHSENGSRFIVGWFGLKDDKECEWIRSPEENARQRRRSSSQTFLPPIVLALEYCGGGDLFKFVQRAANLRLEDHHPEDKRLQVGSQRWLRWSQELAQALAWCKERNVLVGDLKPQNVLLTGDLRIKLSDFNRSTILSAEQSEGGMGLTDPQGTGTSVYAAPELVQPPPSPCSFPADIFALGITMYFLLTGREPYRGIQSAVERMLLISRGGFWEHELGMRWRMLEDAQSSIRASSSKPLKSSLSRSTSSEPSTHSLVSSNTIEALYGIKPDLESNTLNSTLENEEEYLTRDKETRIGFYADGSPKLRYLNGNEIVDQKILILISKMCSPAAVDRPQIDQVILQLKSL
ncbi:hypothetical protein MJO28_014144 [Puccinia striiformis f. sp. tritici]|uniref:Serine/threonine protein kinase n=3 Tax=Puccinia striiformis TaxID=27350 RepID=A0A0L0W4B2_9BASI|nr:hypothetical protein MJO28_014144 [Puccinia striiformis f. sp. tritici]KAI7939265.1 hypothetical protein MJO29_014001 [Puccinia striiformis f. sp. tritici]KNF06334.1 serine/threonine protein kinase [Puccinia striiformis f. sp. tritici PST-78]POW05867.1 hypothetical protein PSTT_09382 [Puccinia striiformis]